MFQLLIIIIGLIVFEVISSIDNAVVNAHVLKTLPVKYRKFFLFWGLLFAVVLIRGLLPFVIVWTVNPSLSIFELLGFVFSGDASVAESIEKSKPILLLGGGTYLYLVALSWLFLEEKKYAFIVEHFIHKRGAWFYAISSVTITIIIYIAARIDVNLAIAASIGSTAFFITDGFKKSAEEKEKELATAHLSAWSKILYLEVLDASFSIDGVIGAFAFTVSVPLILIGNGIGAYVVREFTIRGVDIITKLAYLKNGAMYSIGTLGVMMILESLGNHYPFWLAPLNAIAFLSLFLYLSYKELRLAKAIPFAN